MANKDFHIIFPKDESTDFLQEIIDYLCRKTPIITTIYRIATLDEHLDFNKNIKNSIPDDAFVLFLGHGTSNALSGPYLGTFSIGPLIIDNQLSIFKNKKVILLTCRSTEYLHSFGVECGLKAAIGFPNLITDSYETLYSEQAPDRVADIGEEEIAAFRKIILDIVKYSIEDFINANLSFHQLYKRIKLRAQRALIDYYHSNPNFGKLPFGKMLYDLSEGMSFIGN